MHEMALCTEVTDTVLAEANAVNAVSVDHVEMVIGEVRDIIEDMFDSFFHYLTRGTIAENCAVSFVRTPVTVCCHNCNTQYPVDVRGNGSTTCPHCGERDYEVATGMEFYIASIDVTTPEEASTAA